MTDVQLPVRYLRLAEHDLYDIYDYIARDTPQVAIVFVELIDARISSLAAHPHLGPVVREERLQRLGFRYLAIGDYVAFYKVEDSAILVYRVLHGARDWSRLL